MYKFVNTTVLFQLCSLLFIAMEDAFFAVKGFRGKFELSDKHIIIVVLSFCHVVPEILPTLYL